VLSFHVYDFCVVVVACRGKLFCIVLQFQINLTSFQVILIMTIVVVWFQGKMMMEEVEMQTRPSAMMSRR